VSVERIYEDFLGSNDVNTFPLFSLAHYILVCMPVTGSKSRENGVLSQGPHGTVSFFIDSIAPQRRRVAQSTHLGCAVRYAKSQDAMACE
jgi:hypothetical protein